MIDAKSFFAGFFLAIVIALAASLAFFASSGTVGTLLQPPGLQASPSNCATAQNTILPSGCTSASPLFSPGSGDEIRSLIRSAQKTLYIEMYVFTDETLASELVDAKKRGVDVRIILESRTDSYNLDKIVKAMQDGGIDVKFASTSFQLTHSKLMVIDGKKALVGSINFSKAAQNKNREAAVVLEGEKVNAYSEIFEKDWQMATTAG